MAEDLLVIGRITKPHGIGGEVRVTPFTESPRVFTQYDRIYLRLPDGEPRLMMVRAARPHKNAVLLKLEDVENRDQAEEIIGADLLIQREWLPDPDEDEYYWIDLIGLRVFTENGGTLGNVTNLIAGSEDDLLVIKDDKREILLPFRNEIIREVDLDQGRIVVDPPEGLLDLY
jgi:16S rRNA processing protein RimM